MIAFDASPTPISNVSPSFTKLAVSAAATSIASRFAGVRSGLAGAFGNSLSGIITK